MADDLKPGSTSAAGEPVVRAIGTTLVKRGLAEMLKGGVIMDVVNADEAKIAEDGSRAGAVRHPS
jgi:pyridoxal 5'-phosphate synthase pdxS subunit